MPSIDDREPEITHSLIFSMDDYRACTCGHVFVGSLRPKRVAE